MNTLIMKMFIYDMLDGKASVMSENCNNVFSLFSFNNA